MSKVLSNNSSSQAIYLSYSSVLSPKLSHGVGLVTTADGREYPLSEVKAAPLETDAKK